MNRSTRVRLDMIHRVYALSMAHQESIKGLVDAVQAMGTLLARADALALQQEASNNASEALVKRKEELRRVIEVDHLVHLVRIARVSLPEDRELRSRFRMPRRGVNQQSFVAAVRAILAEASSRKELFVTEGMPESFVEDLQAQLAAYTAAADEQTLGKAGRVGAVADLQAATRELMKLVRRLDGINRKRWAGNAELLAAWVSAKDVSWPHVVPIAERRPVVAAVVPPPHEGSTGQGGTQQEPGAAA